MTKMQSAVGKGRRSKQITYKPMRRKPTAMTTAEYVKSFNERRR